MQRGGISQCEERADGHHHDDDDGGGDGDIEVDDGGGGDDDDEEDEDDGGDGSDGNDGWGGGGDNGVVAMVMRMTADMIVTVLRQSALSCWRKVQPPLMQDAFPWFQHAAP